MRTEFSQSHYTLYELILPYCTVCTPEDGVNGTWHTPITCEEVSDSTYSLWFSSNKAPTVKQPTPSITGKSILNSKVFRCVQAVSESTPIIKPGKGMSSRSTIDATFSDFDGDPGPINFSDEGSFFGKLIARNVLTGKELRVYQYTVADGVHYLSTSATYFIESSHLTNGVMRLKGKDALKDIEKFNEQFPAPSEITLTSDINASTTTIPVTDVSGSSVGQIFVIGDEIMRVTAVGATDLTVAARGSGLDNGDGTVVYKTTAADHEDDDTVQPCYLMDKTFLADALEDIYNAVGLAVYVDSTQWNDEITEWNPTAFLYGVITEPVPAIDLINQMLEVYMIDMWLEQDTQKVKVSAVSAWKESIRTLSEINDIQELKVVTKPNQRFSRAYITHKKPFQALADDKNNYKKYTLHTDTGSEVPDLYGSVEMFEFDPCQFISDSSATQLVSRFVQRFAAPPFDISFRIEERKLVGTSLGDVVSIISRDTLAPDGTAYSARIVAQITQLSPDTKGIGRFYNAKALSYIPLIDSSGGDLTIFVSGAVLDLNLFDRAGGPNIPLNVTFVFEDATLGSDSSQYAVRAGAFEVGTVITIICTGTTKWAAKGGEGGGVIGSNAADGDDGKDSYFSNDLESHIYINYGTVSTYTTNGELFAAGGGGGGAWARGTVGVDVITAAAGGGGSGVPGGIAGSVPTQTSPSNFDGQNGTFNTGGAGGFSSVVGISTSTGGDGGFSLIAGAASASTNVGPTDLGAQGLAGGAFIGANITVYNLAADAAKLRDGNSDAYTLVDS